MASNSDVSLTPGGGWTSITADSAATVAVQNKSGNFVTVMATTSAVAPAGSSWAGYILPPWTDALYVLATSFPGLSSPAYMYARAEQPTTLFVSHD